ncbi:MAG TPA: hypothetical protein VF912_17105 [Anaeromyxobacter sp.]
MRSEAGEVGPGARPRSVAECVEALRHAGAVEGAARIGEARADGRIVRIGLFADGRARFRATTCASLIAYAEIACDALEAGLPASALDAAFLRARVAGVHPLHLERAALVAAAVHAALTVEEP